MHALINAGGGASLDRVNVARLLIVHQKKRMLYPKQARMMVGHPFLRQGPAKSFLTHPLSNRDLGPYRSRTHRVEGPCTHRAESLKGHKACQVDSESATTGHYSREADHGCNHDYNSPRAANGSIVDRPLGCSPCLKDRLDCYCHCPTSWTEKF